jgi:small subunit ribosomal protein S4e
MPQGPRRHLKRLNAPSHWMLSKLGGIFAPKPNPGPHGARECLPLILLLRNRLKYALTGRETRHILMQRFVKVDGKPRTDHKYPAGFMDVVEIEKTNDRFRLLYDPKGRFVLHPIQKKEAAYKLCKVVYKGLGAGNVPYIHTHDGRQIRYPDPEIKTNDTVKVLLENGKITKFVKFQVGNLCYVTGGANRGRIGEIVQMERHPGSFDIVHVRDMLGRQFSTRKAYVFVIGPGNTSWVSLPRGRGIHLSNIEDRKARLKRNKQQRKPKKARKQKE